MAATVKPFSFSTYTEVTPAYYSDLLLFIYQRYIMQHYRHFVNARRWITEEGEVLAFTLLDSMGRWSVNVEIETGNPIKVRMYPSSNLVPRSVLYRLKEDIIILIQLFEESIRRTTLYFAWVKRDNIVPERETQGKKRVLTRIFFGNMLVLFLIFIALSYMVFLVFQMLTPIILVISQLIIVLLSDKIMMRLGDWRITPENPEVYILQYHIPREEFLSFQRNYTRETLLKIKKEIYKRTLALGYPVTKDVAIQVFSEYGIRCRPENLALKSINIYDLVRKAAERFNLPIPKIMVSNVIIPNAAATGPSPKRGLMIITSGLLIQLHQDEVLSVIGHEFSHLKGRDPLVLSSLFMAIYLLRVYVLWQLIQYLGFLYLLVEMSTLYFIAKFFEARADLESAIKLGMPEILAEALRKIGFRRIQLERIPSNIIGGWLGMDPHPPVSFRVARLENLKDLSNIKHPFIRSAIDSVKGFLASIGF